MWHKWLPVTVCWSLLELDRTGEIECSYSTDSRLPLLDGALSSGVWSPLHLLYGKQKVETNFPVRLKKSQQHSLPSHTYTPKSISPDLRVKGFSDKGLRVSGTD